ncbi:hypothetical protein [Modestobacter altitudinis]|uniref:hypothetical protein n=1 Tax=Modestobacter altitudinis TaxID=2213158 RepID=UPI00110CF372|nr:hypothetical protein [Modestobacter altitudinis]
MVPALAALGQIVNTYGIGGDLACHELGLTVTVGQKSVEADIAAFLRYPIPVTLIGEVKGRNRIDQNDLDNLGWLQDRLTGEGFDSLIVLVTAKQSFGPEEVAILRTFCEVRAEVVTVRRSLTPRLPLLLTGEDLFLPWMDEESVRRWGRNDPGLAVHGVALESCKRNLGLLDWELSRTGPAKLNWVIGLDRA